MDASTSLRALGKSRGILIGAAVAPEPLRNDAEYAETLKREFSMVTTENAMKFEPIHPARDRYNFSDADTVVNFAEDNGLKVRGHTLVWHQTLPSWLTAGQFKRDELIKILRDHIATVVGRYRGKVAVWDVVNEAVDDNGILRETIWLKGIGPEYIDMAFKWAHEADPEAMLFYNDYGGEGLGQKSDAIYALVRGLKERKVPIHGVGLQMHLDPDYPPSTEAVTKNVKRLSDLDLEVHITEMDARIKLPSTEEKLEQQAKIYRDILNACMKVKNFKAFTMWGFTDRYSWVPWFFPGYGDALIFDESYNPKPAYKAIKSELAGH